jgi:acyl dehydratase
VPVNRDFIGRQYPASSTFEVGREHIRRFADAIGDPHPAYRDPEAARALGHPDVIAPPTFLTVLNFRFASEGPVADPALGLDYSLVVHGEQTFELHRPVRAGDVLTSVQSVADIRDAGRNELISTVTEVTDADGAPVATLRSTIVSRGTAAASSARPATPAKEA